MESSAQVTVRVAEAADNTPVYLRYGPTGTWTMLGPKTVGVESAVFELMDLEPDTAYKVEASLDADSWPQSDGPATGSFTTLSPPPEPSIDSVVVVGSGD